MFVLINRKPKTKIMYFIICSKAAGLSLFKKAKKPKLP